MSVGMAHLSVNDPAADCRSLPGPTLTRDDTDTGTDTRTEGDRMSLTEFLLARYAEDEAAAQRAGNVKFWRDDMHRSWIESPWGRVDLDLMAMSRTEETLYGHLVLHLPGRVLAECEAKRRIVARHAQGGGVESWMDVDWLADMSDEERAGYCSWCTYDDRTVRYPCPDIRDLALPYADHPDYDEAWRP